jgi:hypothetical protein
MGDLADDIIEMVGGTAAPVEDVMQVDAPTPRRGRGRPRKTAAPASPGLKSPSPSARAAAETAQTATIAASMAEMYAFAGFALMPLRPKTAQALMASAQDCGAAWEAAAVANPAIRRMLEKMAGTSTLAVLAMAHAPIVMAALAESHERKEAKHGDESAAGDAVGAGSPGGRHAAQGSESPVGKVPYLVPVEPWRAPGDSGADS